MATYTRKFKHTDWVDNFDRVKAGGPDGFNEHFHGIEADFDTVGDVLKSLGAQVQAPVTIGLAPLLSQYQNRQQWKAVAFGVAGPNPVGIGTYATMTGTNSQQEAWGALPLSLPNGVNVTKLAVLGSSPSGTMVTDLIQEQHSNGAMAPALATVQGFTSLSLLNKAVFAGDVNLYYLVARITGVTLGDTPLLRGFSITYEPA